jgi:3-deoxy-manno-octulosonate cytidylyltransferase (CMP-KDO synthetase)
MKILGIIPARYASTRFPGKPLALIGGKTMIRRVYDQALQCRDLDYVVVATDDPRIEKEVASFGGNVMMTSPDHKSGTERCGEAAIRLKGRGAGVVINIQGDEPFIHPEQISQLAGLFRRKEVMIGTLVKQVKSEGVLFDPNVVKVIFDKNGRALCFSRQALPYCRGIEQTEWLKAGKFYKHIGLYGYRTEVLKQITELPVSGLEKAESLEQLRWIENGYPVHVAETERESVAIDTPADLLKITNIPG